MSIQNIAHIRGDHFALTCNLSRDATDWSGSTVSCHLRTNTGQLIVDASGGGYVTNSAATANVLSIAVSIPNTETSSWPPIVMGDVQVYNSGLGIKTFTPVQFRVLVSDDQTR